MKRSFWYGIGALLLAGPYLTAPVQAQSLAGIWQGVENETGERDAYWPAVLRLQQRKGNALFGVLYQEVGGQPGITVSFQMTGLRTPTGLRLEHGPKLDETGHTPYSYWCDGAITFTYDANLEKLTGHATYRPVGDCDVGKFILYRIKLKSAATVPAGAETTVRVSGRNVLWYADADLKEPVNSGNTFRTKLSKTTTFYLTQGYFPSSQSAVVPITIKTSGAQPKPTPPVAAAPPPIAAPPDTARPVPAPTPVPTPAPAVPPALPPILSTTPVVLPTVLFRQGRAELLPESGPALDLLAAELRGRPDLKVRIAGHADRIGEPDKNQVLSEQRANAVKAYLVKAGIAAARISTIGYGDTRPLYPSPDARNRRVEVAEVK